MLRATENLVSCSQGLRALACHYNPQEIVKNFQRYLLLRQGIKFVVTVMLYGRSSPIFALTVTGSFLNRIQALHNRHTPFRMKLFKNPNTSWTISRPKTIFFSMVHVEERMEQFYVGKPISGLKVKSLTILDPWLLSLPSEQPKF